MSLILEICFGDSYNFLLLYFFARFFLINNFVFYRIYVNINVFLGRISRQDID